jgi:hypothetical protein
MATLERLVKNKDLKMNYVSSLAKGIPTKTYVHFDKILDTFFVMFVSPETETVIHYIDDYVGLMYDPQNLEVVGVQIESFKEFAQQNQSIEKAWEIKIDCAKVDDLGDLYTVKDKKEKIIAREIAKVAEATISYNDYEMARA